MDERSDSYFLLDPEIEAEFLATLSPLGECSLASGQMLIPALGHAGGGSGVVHAQSPEPRRTILDELDCSSAARVRDALKIGAQLWRVRRWLARRPIAEILDRIRDCRETRTSRIDETATLEDVARFLAARRLVPRPPHCLVDSLALLRWLKTRTGLLFIFGVKLDPFAAHCWVQLGEILLNDHLDHVAPFRPVRVIQC
jgi:Transglutaminase-like superfamily